jgi:hypothetical protein
VDDETNGGDMNGTRIEDTDRIELWTSFLRRNDVKCMAEVGVWRGDFAAEILRRCPSIDTYYMIDPWRHLDDWNKPFNTLPDAFERCLQAALEKTRFAADRVKVLRGRTIEVVHKIPDKSLDFAYIDADHTLRGITIDLQRILPKIRPDGFIGGDDFIPRMWQHGRNYEPSLVFPYAVYFAEAIGARISACGMDQFLIELGCDNSPAFIDHTGRYPEPSVLSVHRNDPRRRLFAGARRFLPRAMRKSSPKREAERRRPEPDRNVIDSST